jgi:pimeloyl-ACP methyl ester carboxylesterase
MESPAAHGVSVYHTPAGEQALLAWYDKVRTAIGFPTTSLVIPTRFGPTHLLAAGPTSAPPVVLLHGMEGNALSWRGQMRALADSFRLYALDIIGSAGKSAPARLSFAGHHHGEWLLDVLMGLDLPDAAFVGISNGSWLIMKLAALAPSRINKAVLMSANGLMPVRFPYRLSRLLESPLGLRVHAAFSPRLVTYARIKRAMLATLPPGILPDADEVEWWYLLARHYRYRFPPPTLLDDDVRQLTAPTMLLMGQRERFFQVPGVIERAGRLLPDLRAAHVIPKAGHSVITEQPDVVNAHLRRFLSA